LQKYKNKLYKIPANTVFIGKKLHYLPTCHSTNDIAATLIASGHAENGMVVITDHQTNGKGQLGNAWEAKPDENITMSVILIPEQFQARDQFGLTLITTVAINRIMHNLGIDVEIKWPNDIYYKGKKLGGILIANSLTGQLLTDSIIGIGLNVNQESFEIGQAVSVKIITGRSYELSGIVSLLLKEIEECYQLFKVNPEGLKRIFLSRLMGLGKKGKFQRLPSGEEFIGVIKGVDELGRLEVLVNDKIEVFNLKEIGAKTN